MERPFVATAVLRHNACLQRFRACAIINCGEGTAMKPRSKRPAWILGERLIRFALCICLLWFLAFSIWCASLRLQPCQIVLWDRLFGGAFSMRLSPSYCAKTVIRVDAVGTLTLGPEVTAFVSDDRRVVGDSFFLSPNGTDDALRTHFRRSTSVDGWATYKVRVRGRLFDDGKRTELVAEQITQAQ